MSDQYQVVLLVDGPFGEEAVGYLAATEELKDHVALPMQIPTVVAGENRTATAYAIFSRSYKREGDMPRYVYDRFEFGTTRYIGHASVALLSGLS